MCCRFYIYSSEEMNEIIESMPRSLIDKWNHTDEVKKSGEIRPTDVAPVIAPNSRGERAVYPMKWGFAEKSLLINARTESASNKPTFADAWKYHRCIIPSSHYFEWEHLRDLSTGKEKTGAKYLIQAKDKEMTYLCGLYRIVDGLPYFVILTREPAEEIKFIHDRMPLILPEERINEWIKPDSRPEDIIGSAVTDLYYEKCAKEQ